MCVQVYVIKVTCRDGSHYLIFRRYRQFDEMQKHLEQRFPVEAGDFNQKERILPNLPGRLSAMLLCGVWHCVEGWELVSISCHLVLL